MERLPEMKRLGAFLFRHLEGIAVYCDHPVRFGVVESINPTIKAVLRRARGMRDEEMLLLKLKWATAHPIHSAKDLVRFLSPQPVYSSVKTAKESPILDELNRVREPGGRLVLGRQITRTGSGSGPRSYTVSFREDTRTNTSPITRAMSQSES
jgi:hypothetical protein